MAPFFHATVGVPKPATHVGNCSRIAAGSVVLQDVPPHVTVAGVPARIVGPAGTAEPGRTMDQTFDARDAGHGPDDYAML